MKYHLPKNMHFVTEISPIWMCKTNVAHINKREISNGEQGSSRVAPEDVLSSASLAVKSGQD